MAENNSLQVASSQSSLQRQSFEPTNMKEAIEFSKMIADSDLAPKDFRQKPANVLVAIQMGYELNVPPMQALQGIAVINGRPTVWGDLMWALVTTHKDFEDAQETVTDASATITLKRRGRSPVTVTFTKADAEKAGLWGKSGPWQTYPKRQMQWRARTFAARDLFPDALKGLTSAEEAQDYQTIEGQPATTPAQAMATAQVQPQGAAAEDTIGKELATTWYKTYKANGHTPEDAKSFLKETFGIQSPRTSADIPKSGWEKAEKWATTKASVRLEADKLFTEVGFTQEECLQFVNDQKWNWPMIVEELKKIIEKRNQAEQ